MNTFLLLHQLNYICSTFIFMHKMAIDTCNHLYNYIMQLNGTCWVRIILNYIMCTYKTTVAHFFHVNLSSHSWNDLHNVFSLNRKRMTGVSNMWSVGQNWSTKGSHLGWRFNLWNAIFRWKILMKDVKLIIIQLPHTD